MLCVIYHVDFLSHITKTFIHNVIILSDISFFTKLGDRESGAGKFYRYQAYRSGSPSLFKYAPLGRPSVLISGMSNVKKGKFLCFIFSHILYGVTALTLFSLHKVFNKEFKLVKTGVLSEELGKLFGGESLLFVTDPDRHQYMRRLVGQSMTPEQINFAMPALMKSANEQMNALKVGDDVEMEKVLTSFTLDVAWRQILGMY